MDKAQKTCPVCGRAFSWRKKWEKNWDEVVYCSEKCRRTKLNKTDRALEAAIEGLLAERKAGGSICPSEAARRVAGDNEEVWRELMEATRRAARRLAARGIVEITQKGQVVDPSTAKGPIRIRLRQGTAQEG